MVEISASDDEAQKPKLADLKELVGLNLGPAWGAASIQRISEDTSSDLEKESQPAQKKRSVLGKISRQHEANGEKDARRKQGHAWGAGVTFSDVRVSAVFYPEKSRWRL